MINHAQQFLEKIDQSLPRKMPEDFVPDEIILVAKRRDSNDQEIELACVVELNEDKSINIDKLKSFWEMLRQSFWIHEEAKRLGWVDLESLKATKQ